MTATPKYHRTRTTDRPAGYFWIHIFEKICELHCQTSAHKPSKAYFHSSFRKSEHSSSATKRVFLLHLLHIFITRLHDWKFPTRIQSLGLSKKRPFDTSTPSGLRTFTQPLSLSLPVMATYLITGSSPWDRTHPGHPTRRPPGLLRRHHLRNSAYPNALPINTHKPLQRPCHLRKT